MRIREVKDETVAIGPKEPPEIEKMPSVELEAEATKIVSNGVAVLNGGGDGEDELRLDRIENGVEKRKTSASSSSAGGTHGRLSIFLTKRRKPNSNCIISSRNLPCELILDFCSR